ncbi:hypothetical protein GQ43DRAFT_9937 [Delitschia confertaspora ATCC 74209]|uniref:Uncharacterized protein n=1 Tax=Delitschia confertaspora ATCC 74209 TaxID=1513339 RepID=A0A9P4JRX6_9PLEO|nr:hypothetical protein GQ43DRAFT_9937 [Delitschia confertaspora ATCC 74209]
MLEFASTRSDSGYIDDTIYWFWKLAVLFTYQHVSACLVPFFSFLLLTAAILPIARHLLLSTRDTFKTVIPSAFGLCKWLEGKFYGPGIRDFGVISRYLMTNIRRLGMDICARTTAGPWDEGNAHSVFLLSCFPIIVHIVGGLKRRLLSSHKTVAR